MTLSVKLNQELRTRVQHLAELQQRSAHWVMCEAIRQYVEHEEAKEQLKQEALAAWADYQETGKHLTLTEINEWLNTWGTNNEKGMPKCHE